MQKIIMGTVSLMFSITAASVMLSAAPVPVEGGSAEEKAAGMTWSFTPDPSLPNVLIIGDSISIGYTLWVREQLKGVANVYRPLEKNGIKPLNCGDTARGLSQLDAWIGTNIFRVIHFNFGLHDLKYLDAKGQYVPPDKGTQVAPPEKYEKNLRDLVVRLQKTGAILVWGSTTPVPDDSPGRVKGDELVYNAIAKKVMEENGVIIDDLLAALGDRIGELQKPNNVHFTDEGSKVLAASVAASINLALKRPWTAPSAPPAPVLASSYTLEKPVQVSVKNATYITAAIIMPQAIAFKPGLVIEVKAELECDVDPSGFSVQICSADGKMSTLPLKNYGKTKSAAGRFEIPEKPMPHPSAKNRETWSDLDTIRELRVYFTLPAKADAVITVTSLRFGPAQ
ncbi:MAG: SGNH/GDSL hydrolase family protein [Spirochaetes bacterium]|nr:SGNH/GDSL hydrolase family protein [Spirochaetota bacterium]